MLGYLNIGNREIAKTKVQYGDKITYLVETTTYEDFLFGVTMSLRRILFR